MTTEEDTVEGLIETFEVIRKTLDDCRRAQLEINSILQRLLARAEGRPAGLEGCEHD